MGANYISEPLNDLEKELLHKWLRKADGDLRVAGLLEAATEDYDILAFYCQQAAEKYLKARIAATGIEPERTPDLSKLMATLEHRKEEAFSEAEKAMGKLLSPFGVEIRYPGEDELEPPVAELLAAARHFRSRLRPVVETLLNT